MRYFHHPITIACLVTSLWVSSSSAQTTPTVHVDSPNGGEVFETGSTHRVAWTGMLSPDINPQVIVYLYKSGQFYATVAFALFWDGGVDWTLCPTIEEGDDYSVVLYAEGYPSSPSATDESDGVFTVHSSHHPAINVLSPGPGDILQAGQAIPVHWTSTDFPHGEVSVELYDGEAFIDNLGYTWIDDDDLTVVLSDCAPTGSYYRLAVSWLTCNPCISGFSEPFTITNPVSPEPFRIINPNGDEVWHAGQPQLVTWTGPKVDWSNVPYCMIFCPDHSRGIPASWILTGHNSIVVWACPNSAEDGAECILRLGIRDCGHDITAQSDAPFTIITDTRHPTFTLLEPIGGTTLRPDEPITVRWNSTDLSGSVSARLLKNGEYVSDLGAAPVSLGELTGTICPAAPDGDDYRIIIGASENCTSITDSSAPLTMLRTTPRPTITIQNPASGDVWISGISHTIKWNATGITGNVSVQLIRGEEYVDYLGEVSVEMGELTTRICGRMPGDNYQIAVTTVLCDNQRQYRSESFTIVPDEHPAPSLQLTSLNSGEPIAAGSHQLITWSSTAIGGTVSVYLVLGTWEIMDLGEVPIEVGHLEWNVCSTGIDSDDYSIELVTYSECYGLLKTYSDKPFAIAGAGAQPRFVLTSPLFGEEVIAGQIKRITWSSTNPSGNIRISLWQDGHEVMSLGEAPMGQGYLDWPVCPWLGSRAALSPLDSLAYGIRIEPPACTIVDWIPLSAFTIKSPGEPMADLNHDCAVDGADIEVFQKCVTGPTIRYNLHSLPPGCPYRVEEGPWLQADLDEDGDVDQADFGLLQRSLTRPAMSSSAS